MRTTPVSTAAPGPPALDPRGEPLHVAVLGAGLAGLMAAQELERLGHDVHVLEMRPEVGGRVRTHAFRGPDGPLAELGAMRIPAGHEATMRCVDALGLSSRLRPFRTLFSDDASFLAGPNGHRRVREASPELVAAFLRDVHVGPQWRPETVLCAAWLTASVAAIAPAAFHNTFPEDMSRRLLDLLDGIDVRPFVVGGLAGSSMGRRIDVNRFLAENPEFGAESPLRHFFADVITEMSSTLFRLDGGMSQIATRMAARLRRPVRRGVQVVGLHVERDAVQVQVRGRQKLQRSAHRFEHVLCTLPFSVLRTMPVTGIAADKAAVINDMLYWDATKVAVHCREPFWEREGISGGGSFVGGLARQTYYPPVESDPRLGATLLASYTIGPDADMLGKVDPARRAAAVLDELAAVHPELASPGAVLGTVTQVWGEDPSTVGAASVRWSKDPAAAEEERLLAARPSGRLFFAGEHCSRHPAWIEGALESGLAAAHDLHLSAPARVAGSTATAP